MSQGAGLGPASKRTSSAKSPTSASLPSGSGRVRPASPSEGGGAAQPGARECPIRRRGRRRRGGVGRRARRLTGCCPIDSRPRPRDSDGSCRRRCCWGSRWWRRRPGQVRRGPASIWKLAGTTFPTRVSRCRWRRRWAASRRRSRGSGGGGRRRRCGWCLSRAMRACRRCVRWRPERRTGCDRARRCAGISRRRCSGSGRCWPSSGSRGGRCCWRSSWRTRQRGGAEA